MGISSARDQGIDYAPCRYGGSRLWFRGPRRSLRSSYVACLGGCGVYGRYVEDPWPHLLEARIGRTVVNLGIENVGLDAYLNDPGALATAANARVLVIQMTGAQNTSNRFYATHPRRNDRFLKASPALMSLYPEMDFTEVHFTKHLLARLFDICPQRFAVVATEVQTAWRARLRALAASANGDVFFLWLARHPLEDEGGDVHGMEPLLTRAWITPLSPFMHALIESVPTNWQGADDTRAIPAMEQSRAAHLPGAAAHREVAEAVARAISPVLQ